LRKKSRGSTIRFRLNLRNLLTLKLQTVVIIGLIARLAIAPFFAHPFDMNAWYINGEAFLNGGQNLLNYLVPYRYSFFLFVFPGTWLFTHLASFFPNFTIPISALDPRLNPGSQWGISVIPGLLYDFLLKLPLIASDTLVALILFKIVNRESRDEKIAVLASALWFLNPLVIWVSSGWGMFDDIPTLFTVLALYFLSKGKFSVTALMLVLATVMKFYAIVLFVPLFIIVWRKSGLRGILPSLATTGISASLFSIPLFFISNPLSYVTASTPSAAFQYAGMSLWTALSLAISTLDLSLVSDIFVVASLALAYFFIIKTKSMHNEFTTTVCYFLIPLTVLLIFYKFVGENYLVWIIPFSAILAANNTRIRKMHWSISLLALISSVTDSLLPYYMLTLSPWIGGFLITVLGLIAPERVAPNGTAVQGITVGKLFLSSLGVISTAILLLSLVTIITILKKNKERNGGFEK
jgi:Gpi18-like mannosyltransferase